MAQQTLDQEATMDITTHTSDERLTEIALKAAHALRDGVDPLTDAWASENALSASERFDLRLALAASLRGTLLVPEPVRVMVFLAAACRDAQEARQRINNVARNFVEPRAKKIIEKLQSINRGGDGPN
jgi:hypothetical protein